MSVAQTETKPHSNLKKELQDFDRTYLQGAYNAMLKSQAVIEFDLEGIVLSANDIFLNLMGYQRDEVIGKHHSIFCSPSYTETADYREFWKLLGSGKFHSGEYHRISKAGEDIFIQASYNPIFDENGSPTRILKLASDVTLAKKKALEDDGKVTAIDRAQGMIEFDLNGYIQSANENFLSLMGYSLEEIQGKHHRMFVTQEEAESPAYRAFWDRLKAGTFDSGEYCRINRNKEKVWIQATYNPILNGQGKPLKVIKFCSDITAAKTASLEATYRIKAVSDYNLIIELDPTGKIIKGNTLAEQALGLSQAQLLSRKLKDIYGANSHLKQSWEDLFEELSLGKACSGEFEMKHEKDSSIWLSGSFSPVLNVAGNLDKVLLIGREITQSKMKNLDADGKLGAIDRAQAVIEFDMHGHVLCANKNFLDLMEYSHDDIEGKHHQIFVEPEYAKSREYENFWHRLSRGQFDTGEYKRMTKSGKEVWIQATYNPVYDPTGKPIKVVKFATDVTASKLLNSEFEAKVNAVDLGQAVIEFDLQGNILKANRNFLKAMGYTLREIQGQHHSIFCTLQHSQSPEYRDFWLKLNEGEVLSGRFHRVGKFDRDVWIHATYSPIYDLNGNVMKVIKYAYDVTKEVQMEQIIKAESIQMEKLCAKILNDVDKILMDSKGADQMVKSGLSSTEEGSKALEKSQEAISNIRQSSNRVAEIVKVISEIASQTNLLAFNAAIEAARAGEHGIGFSVVASEVRKLAEKSSKATEEITLLIQESSEHVRNGVEVTENASGSFDGITRSLNETTEKIDRINQLSNEQLKSLEELRMLFEKMQVCDV